MKKKLSILVLLGLVLVLLTGCGEKGMDGSWDCVEAQITANSALLSAYRTLEQNGAIGTFCQVEIKEGQLVKYIEDVTTYTVASSSQKGDVITAKVNDRYSSYNITLSLVDDGNQIIVKRDSNRYTLERADFFNRVILGFFKSIPVWLYIVGGVFLVIVIIGTISTRKGKNNAGGNRPAAGNPGNPGGFGNP